MPVFGSKLFVFEATLDNFEPKLIKKLLILNEPVTVSFKTKADLTKNGAELIKFEEKLDNLGAKSFNFG